MTAKSSACYMAAQSSHSKVTYFLWDLKNSSCNTHFFILFASDGLFSIILLVNHLRLSGTKFFYALISSMLRCFCESFSIVCISSIIQKQPLISVYVLRKICFFLPLYNWSINFLAVLGNNWQNQTAVSEQWFTLTEWN